MSGAVDKVLNTLNMAFLIHKVMDGAGLGSIHLLLFSYLLPGFVLSNHKIMIQSTIIYEVPPMWQAFI